MKIILTGNRNYSESTHIYIGGMPYNGMHSSTHKVQCKMDGVVQACPTNDNNFSYMMYATVFMVILQLT